MARRVYRLEPSSCVVRWLYRLQARLGLAGPEGAAALAIVAALAGGAVAVEVQSNAVPVAPGFYAASDSAFARASLSDSSGEGTEEAAAPLALASLDGPETAPDDAAEEPVPDVAAPDALAGDLGEVVDAPRRSGRKPPPVRTNLNTATEAELQRLPGIGPALAARVVAYRRQRGRFASPEQIVEVRGIGPKTYEKLAPWLYVR